MPEARRRPIRTALRATVAAAPSGGRLDRIELARLRELAVAADASGIDGFFVEHVAGSDPYVVLGAIAPVTTAVSLGCLATPAGARPPAVLAKTVTTLDVVSKGRAVLALAPGASLGGATGDGAAQRDDSVAPTSLLELADEIEICRAMVRVPGPSYAGPTASIVRAWNEPRFAGAGPLPIALLVPARGAGAGERGDVGWLRAPAELLALAARFADLCVIDVGPASTGTFAYPSVEGDAGPVTAATMRAGFDAACLVAGRPPGEVGLVAVCALRPAGIEGCAAGDWSVEEVLFRASSWLAAGYDGIVVDVGVPGLGDDRVLRLVDNLSSLRGPAAT